MKKVVYDIISIWLILKKVNMKMKVDGENFPNGEMLVARPIGFPNSWFMMKSNNLKGKVFVVCVLGFQTADRT